MVPARDRATDFADARFTIKAVLAIVGFTAMMVGSQWAFSASLQQSITALGARMDAKDVIDKRDEEARTREDAADARIINDRLAMIDEKIKQIEREYKLEDYDLKALITNKR